MLAIGGISSIAIGAKVNKSPFAPTVRISYHTDKYIGIRGEIR